MWSCDTTPIRSILFLWEGVKVKLLSTFFPHAARLAHAHPQTARTSSMHHTTSTLIHSSLHTTECDERCQFSDKRISAKHCMIYLQPTNNTNNSNNANNALTPFIADLRCCGYCTPRTTRTHTCHILTLVSSSPSPASSSSLFSFRSPVLSLFLLPSPFLLFFSSHFPLLLHSSALTVPL